MHTTREDAVAQSAHRPHRRVVVCALHGLLLVGGLIAGGAGCQTKSLHPSYGLRFHEMLQAQQNARGTHDPVAHGDEAVAPVQNYLQKLSGSTTPGGGGSDGGALVQPSNATAGVKPLVR